MNNYLLSIDPSIKNTGFTLWENDTHGCDCDERCNGEKHHTSYWRPIFITSYNFNIYSSNTSLELKWKIRDYIIPDIDKKPNNTSYWLDMFDLVIERGIFNPKLGRGKETLDHLRGFIAGTFNKLLTKDMLVSSSEWRKWYKEKGYLNLIKGKDKWDKELSLAVAIDICGKNNWNIEIKDHDQAESLLIGWYYINKEVK